MALSIVEQKVVARVRRCVAHQARWMAINWNELPASAARHVENRVAAQTYQDVINAVGIDSPLMCDDNLLKAAEAYGDYAELYGDIKYVDFSHHIKQYPDDLSRIATWLRSLD